MTKISRRDAERKIHTLEIQRDTAVRMMRLWVYLSLAAVLTLLFTQPVWGIVYIVLFILFTAITGLRMRRAAES
jgi:uncharacterized membrane protein YjjP (DUF1212 family)